VRLGEFGGGEFSGHIPGEQLLDPAEGMIGDRLSTSRSQRSGSTPLRRAVPSRV
jgi:hypothetical protein